jgi:electron transfer flavoprotein alpha subunit
MTDGVLVVAEHRNGKITDATLELLAAGLELKEASGGSLRVVLLGQDVASLVSRLAGADEVLTGDHGKLEAFTPEGYVFGIRAILEDWQPRVILVAHSSQGIDLAPRLAAELNAPIVGNCIALRFEDGTLMATRKIYNEKIVEELAVGGDGPVVVTVRPAAYRALEGGTSPEAKPITANFDNAEIMRRVLGYEEVGGEDIDISEADVVVSAGRGIGDQENLALIEEFSRILGGVVGASRPLTDAGWLPKTRQVGQSGKTVKPKLYIACGISGAMQHVSGMKDAGLIIAINTDPNAPIFDVAHFGVVGNLREVIPKTIEALKSA